jgi:hypothetical protein
MGTVTDAVKAVNEALARHKGKTEDASAAYKAWVVASFMAIRKEFFPCVAPVGQGEVGGGRERQMRLWGYGGIGRPWDGRRGA